MSEIICPKCKGTGEQISHFFGIFTFGLGYLLQADGGADICKVCKGTGRIKLNEAA